MFGYVRVFEDELKLREFRLYKAVYCGLCHSLKKNLGFMSTVTLSYDFVFLALAISEAENEEFKGEKKRCTINIFRKKLIAKENNSLKYCAGAEAILTYCKLLDDISDTKGFKKIIYKFLRPFYKRIVKKAIKKFPEYKFDVLFETVQKYLSELSELEKANSVSPEQNADIFGKLLGKVFAHALIDEKNKNSLYELGYRTGKFIYIADLIDDFADDKLKGNYNPLICAGYSDIPLNILTASLAFDNEKALNSLNEIPVAHDDVRAIINNVLKMGMPNLIYCLANKDKCSTKCKKKKCRKE